MQTAMSVTFIRRINENIKEIKLVKTEETEENKMYEIDNLEQFIQAEVKKQIEKVQINMGDRNKFTTGRYREVRKKFRDELRFGKFDGGFFEHKILKAITEIAKADVGVSYMSKATEVDFEKMADVYEVIAEAYLNYKKSQTNDCESEER